MKPSKSISVRSMKSLQRMNLSSNRAIVYELQIDFVRELKDACDNFGCHGIEVNRRVVNDEFLKNLKADHKKVVSKRISLAPTAAAATAAASAFATAAATSDVKPPLRDSQMSISSATQLPLEDVNAVVDAYYDAQDELVEVVVSKAKDCPRKLIQCIALFEHHFRFMVKISIVKSKINGYTLHELQKLLRHSATITDICLDETRLSESDYGVLLSERTKLRHLSLSRCQIYDDTVGTIASYLHYKAPASKTLLALNLSCNCITDVGAKHLALALRSNRCLRYLNLASNCITDDGALALFDTLRQFPLLYDDLFKKRKRRFDYLKKKKAIYMKYFEDSDTRDADETTSRKSMASRRSKITGISPKKTKKETGDVDLATKVELLSLEILGLFNDPYGAEQVTVRDGVPYCLGNIVLCCLNLAYNSLSYLSIARLQSVLLYQSTIKKPTDHGLLRVLIDGNPLPISCSEFDVIGQALTNSVFRQMGAGERRRASVPFRRTALH